jgi:predicted component of type VI protein secretion system
MFKVIMSSDKGDIAIWMKPPKSLVQKRAKAGERAVDRVIDRVSVMDFSPPSTVVIEVPGLNSLFKAEVRLEDFEAMMRAFNAPADAFSE